MRSRSLRPSCTRLFRWGSLSAGYAAHDCGGSGLIDRHVLFIDEGSGLLIPRGIFAVYVEVKRSTRLKEE